MVVSFQGYIKKEHELKKYKESVCKVIDDFILNDNHFQKDHNDSPIRDYHHSFDFHMNDKYGFGIYYFYCPDSRDKIHLRQHDITFTPEEFKRLKTFMKDPKLFKGVNKYNL